MELEPGFGKSHILNRIISELPDDASTETFICPHCKQSFEATSSEAKMEPEEGDPSICMHCGEFMCWHDGAMQVCTEEELEKLQANPLAMKVSTDIKAWNLRRNN